MIVRYRLTYMTLWHIRARSTGIKKELAKALKRSGSTINRYIRENEYNDALTAGEALKVLRHRTGLTNRELIEDGIAALN